MSSLKDRKSSRIEGAAVIAGEPERPPGLPEVVTGSVARVSANGVPEVTFHGNPAPGPVAALTTASVGPEHVGREVALVFVDGDPLRPLILGLIRETSKAALAVGDEAGSASRAQVLLDGERVVLSAEREIELRCGKASLILTRAGKVLIRGAYLLNRSSGVNRIKGGSVQIN